MFAVKEETFQTETLARIFLEQGDPKRAAEIFTRLLEHEPGNRAAAEGLSRCQVLLGRGEKAMQERRLAALKLMLSRLRGEPVETPAAPAAQPSAPEPQQRKRLLLQGLLEKVVAWRSERAGRR